MTIKSPTVILQSAEFSAFFTIAIGATAATVALVGFMALPACWPTAVVSPSQWNWN